MPCFCPIPAYQPDSGGALVFSERAGYRPIEISCGQCVGCRLERSRQWAMRCLHECQMHEFNSFVTLTYNDEHVPKDGSLRYSDFQAFMRRLRKRVGKVRFYMCGEYGAQFGRPHFHACLFGWIPPDRVFYRDMPSGARLYTSEVLEDLWPFGFSSVGDVTFESAAYVARYCLKKVTGAMASDHYRRVSDDGEIYWLVPEFNHMSLKPGIGFDWFRRYQSEVYPFDRVIVRGMEVKPPKYYDNLLKLDNSFVLDEVQYDRYKKSLETLVDTTPERLRVRELCTRARLEFKKRIL